MQLAPGLTSMTVVEVGFALFVTVLTLASVSVCLIVLGCRVFVHQIHHKNCLQKAQQHQSKNPNAVERWERQAGSLIQTNNYSLSQHVPAHMKSNKGMTLSFFTYKWNPV